MSVPALRFPEFGGEWEEKRLGAIAQFSKGKGISKADVVESGMTPCVRYGELYTTYGRQIETVVSFTNRPESELLLSAGGEILIPASGETSYDIATATVLPHSNVAIGGDLNVVKTAENGFFIASYLSGKRKRHLARMAQGNSVVHLYKEQIASTSLHLPTLPEQKKIAAFLGAVDARIAGARKRRDLLETYKRGLMQALFSRTLRFTRPDDTAFPDWEECELGEVLHYEQPTPYLVSSTDYDDDFRTPVLTAGKTFILGYSDETEGIYKPTPAVIIFDDFTTASKFVNFPFKAKSSAMKILSLKRDGDQLKLLYELLQLLPFEAGDHKRHWISEFQPLTISLPHPGEQQKIADALSAMDAKIDAVAGRLAQLEAFKKGLLQQMFV